MPMTVKVKVLRHMKGDKDYEPGQFRTLPVADAERLADTGAVQIVSKASHSTGARMPRKARGAKAQGASPKTKAEGRSGSTK